MRVQMIHDQNNRFRLWEVDVYQSRIQWAKSIIVRRSVTLTCRHASSGAKKTKRLRVPLRSYFDNVKLGL